MIGESTDGTSYIDANACRWCGLIHKGTCHRVEEIEYHPDGTVKRVKLRGGGQPVESVPTITIGPVLDPPNTCSSTWDGESGDWSWTAVQ